MNVRLYIWQRTTAALLAPMIFTHIAMIFYATRHGMSAADILARTQGNLAWGAFYALFVIIVAIHASIGLRNVLIEWLPLSRRRADRTAIGIGLLLLVLGLRAVAAVVL